MPYFDPNYDDDYDYDDELEFPYRFSTQSDINESERIMKENKEIFKQNARNGEYNNLVRLGVLSPFDIIGAFLDD